MTTAVPVATTDLSDWPVAVPAASGQVGIKYIGQSDNSTTYTSAVSKDFVLTDVKGTQTSSTTYAIPENGFYYIKFNGNFRPASDGAYFFAIIQKDTSGGGYADISDVQPSSTANSAGTASSVYLSCVAEYYGAMTTADTIKINILLSGSGGPFTIQGCLIVQRLDD